MLELVDTTLARLLALLKWAALGVAFLLFAQWPLRDWFHAYSREANDLGQCLFALFVAGSVTAATRARYHIAADSLARAYRPQTRRLLASIGILFGLLPWTVFVAWSGWSTVTRSVAVLERFQDTGNNGYFVIKLALALMIAMMLAQMLIDIFQPADKPARQPHEAP